MKRLLAFSAVVVLSAVLLAPAAHSQDKGKEAGGPPPLPPPRAVPGLTADDLHPNACVDCHKNMPEMKMDARLSTLMNAWVEKVEGPLLEKAQAAAPEGVKLVGKHPKAGVSAMKDVPKKCLTCHKATSTKAPPFGRMLHKIHLVGGEKNVFMTVHQGECTHCHKLDQATGGWTFPSGPEPAAAKK